jgi:hypothetical protein
MPFCTFHHAGLAYVSTGRTQDIQRSEVVLVMTSASVNEGDNDGATEPRDTTKGAKRPAKPIAVRYASLQGRLRRQQCQSSCAGVWVSGPLQLTYPDEPGVGDPIGPLSSGPIIGYRSKTDFSNYLTASISGKRSVNLNFCLKMGILHNMKVSISYFMKTIRSDYSKFFLLFS